ncbi:hypothetical protein BT63DRAFT_402168 [Microthyrium microscopicum]|uniref:Uncharacterized protein n=1 Tax=Microthyrium microscopicum TaxID=703497 RepID=A0A6A6U8K1_9PEZI|nr:hypothetical protein BT63DRAFT_402168 [Microthyrium microscopicum]
MRLPTTTAAILGLLTTLSTSSPLEPGLNDLSRRQAPKGKGAPRAQRADTAVSLKETTWNPPASMKQDLDDVWAWVIKRRPQDLKRGGWVYNQILDNNGALNYCVRWHSSATADAATRAAILKGLQVQSQKWADLLVGFDGWPYTKVPVKIVGWAGTSQALFPGLNETAEGKYSAYKDQEGVPQCNPDCGHFFHMNSEFFPKCQNPKENMYSMSLWLSDNLGGGAGGGGDWGQRTYRTATIAQFKAGGDAMIYLHEMGHSYAIDDFYDWKPKGQTNFIMMAGSSSYITEFDAWMARDWWRHIKPKNLGGSSSGSTMAGGAPKGAGGAPKGAGRPAAMSNGQ